MVVLSMLVGCGEPQADAPPTSSSSSSSDASEGSSTGVGGSTGSSSDSTGPGGGESTLGADSTSTGGGPPPPPGIPSPTAPCPAFEDGVMSFCPASAPTCRNVRVINAFGADGSGPLALHWHGSFESPDVLLAEDEAVGAIAQMTIETNGLLILPYADPDAPARENNPFPWWVVCSDDGTECDRQDDFALADEIVACAVQAGQVDHERLVVSGMSAGGIMTSHLVGRTEYFAGAVSFSGGIPEEHRPVVPPGSTAVMAIHGGPNDMYCGPGVEGCYDFVEPTEWLAVDVDAAGNFAFVCDHQIGHTALMGPEAAGFMGVAHASGHPWEGLPFDAIAFPGIASNCYEPGGVSPWR